MDSDEVDCPQDIGVAYESLLFSVFCSSYTRAKNLFDNGAMTVDENEFISDAIRDHYEDPYHRGSLENASHSAEGSIPVCGDEMRVELRISHDHCISEAWFEANGCVLSQAAASMLMEKVENMSVEEAMHFSANDMLELVGGTIISPARRKCGLLAWRVFQSALEMDTGEDSDADSHFGGPSLGEES